MAFACRMMFNVLTGHKVPEWRSSADGHDRPTCPARPGSAGPAGQYSLFYRRLLRVSRPTTCKYVPEVTTGRPAAAP